MPRRGQVRWLRVGLAAVSPVAAGARHITSSAAAAVTAPLANAADAYGLERWHPVEAAELGARWSWGLSGRLPSDKRDLGRLGGLAPVDKCPGSCPGQGVGVGLAAAFGVFFLWGLKDILRLPQLTRQGTGLAEQGATSAAAGYGAAGDAGEKASNDDTKEDGDGGDAGSADAGASSAAPTAEPETPLAAAPPPTRWSTWGLIGLTLYRFYTGFLSATWLPFLLAMEGQDLWQENQSIFMGLAKLLYAAAVLLNPVLGLAGDRLAAVSRAAGRRVVLRLGVLIAGFGMLLCILAEGSDELGPYLFGLLVWRLGEAANDVATEALVPEVVPEGQFQVAAAVKACSFFLGGMAGYVMLVALADISYGWLYYAYPFMMLACSIPALAMTANDEAFINVNKPTLEHDLDQSMKTLFQEAYLGPMNYRGGFPLSCLAVLIFSVGTAPMFFLLLIARDLGGIKDPVQLQREFSISSIIFFTSSAVFSAVGAHPGNTGGRPLPPEEVLRRRGESLVCSMTFFALVVTGVPLVAAVDSRTGRDAAFYFLAACLGCASGVAFSRFQDLTWRLMPASSDAGMAMGFSVMCRLLGVGIGNFVAGLILDLNYLGDAITDPDGWTTYKGWTVDSEGVLVGPLYSTQGYIVMCTTCGLCALASSALAWVAIKRARDSLEAAAARRRAVPTG